MLLAALFVLSSFQEPPMPDQPPLSPREAIEANANLVAETMSDAAGFALARDERSLAYVDGFIGRQREGWLAAGQTDQYVSILGSFAGAVVIEQHDGTWVQDEGGIAVEIRPGFRVFPMNKVRKQIENGEDDSILSWFQTIGPMLAAAPDAR